MQDRIRVATNALVVHDGRALLVEFSGGTYDEHYNLPGGGEVGETLEEGLLREVMEETCLTVRVERLLLIVESIGSRNTNRIGDESVPWNELRFFFHCTPLDPDEARLPDLPDHEQTGVLWVPLARLPSVAVLPQVSQELLAALRDSASRAIVIANPG